MRRDVGLLACLPLLLAAVTGHAATTARMAGTIVDEQESPLAGVTVEISSDSLIGGPQQSVTGADGSFAFLLLPVGEYEVSASLAGFQPSTAVVQVRLGRAATIGLRMVPLEFAGAIEVTGEIPVVDVTQVDTSLVMGEEYLQRAAVGAAGRDYLRMLGQAPGSVDASYSKLFGQAPGSVSSGYGSWVNGSTRGGNTYLVDGIDVSDPSHGTSSIGLSYDAIQEMSFSTGGFEAEYGRALGGIVNLVTKSGGNEYSGTVDARYRDENLTESGDHFDPDVQSTSSQSFSATLGGPILRDRLWFFLAAENGARSWQDAGVEFPYDSDHWRYLAKATWQISGNNRLQLKYSGEDGEVAGSNSSLYVERTASSTETRESSVWQAELGSVLSESLLLTAQAGYTSVYDDIYSSHGEERSGHRNLNTLVYSHAYYWPELWDRSRWQVRADLSWFVDDLGGSHSLKTGAEYHDLKYERRWWFGGGGHLWDLSEPPGEEWVDLNNDGYFNQVLQTKGPAETARDSERANGEVLSFFVQDEWRPHPNLVVKPGLRFDRALYTDPYGATVADVGSWQPRLGIAWDVLGDARHVVRASAGRFMDPSMLELAGWAAVSSTWEYYWTHEYLCNSESLCTVDEAAAVYGEPTYLTNDEGIDYVLFDWFALGSNRTVDQLGLGTLEAPYADQLVLAYETRLAEQTSLELSYVSKRSEKLFEDTCSGNEWVWGAGPEPDPDDPSTWPSMFDCPNLVFANIPGRERKYDAFIAKLEARRGRFHLITSYTYSDSRGNSVTGPDATWTIDSDAYPIDFVNQYGKLPDHRRNLLKISGYLLLPHEITLGFNGFYASASPQSVLALCRTREEAYANPNAAAQLDGLGVDPGVFDYCADPNGEIYYGWYMYLRPRGDLEARSSWQVDLQLDKVFHLGKVDLRAMLTVYNLFDREYATSFNSFALTEQIDEQGNPVLDDDGNAMLLPVGEPLSYAEPRRYELGVRIEF